MWWCLAEALEIQTVQDPWLFYFFWNWYKCRTVETLHKDGDSNASATRDIFLSERSLTEFGHWQIHLRMLQFWERLLINSLPWLRLCADVIMQREFLTDSHSMLLFHIGRILYCMLIFSLPSSLRFFQTQRYHSSEALQRLYEKKITCCRGTTSWPNIIV
jgi:hypothetical protein